MSRFDAHDPICTGRTGDIRWLLEPRSKDLGGFSVRRVLPSASVRKVGPFVFFDEMGPADFPPGQGINVRPHPHIGLSTVTFLFEGEILHRDSLGYVQPIEPGAVNLMTAGKGIVHSERTSDERLAGGQKLHGIQVWMALPDDRQEIEPSFLHYPKYRLPVVNREGVTTTVIIGVYAGQQSPVAVHARTIYLEQRLEEGATIEHDLSDELAVYVVSGSVRAGDCVIDGGQMAVFSSGGTASLTANRASRIMIIGGEAMSDRYLFWNFVSTSRGRIELAKQQWRNGRFDMIPGDEEFIPLPE